MQRFLPYGRQFIEDDDIAAVSAVLRSDYLTTGPAVAKFEAALKDLGTDMSLWGKHSEIPAGLTTSTSTGGVSRRFFQRRIVLLDPMMLAPRLLAHAGFMANGVLQILAPQSDPRLASLPPFPKPVSDFLSAETANIAIASSPLSGLIDWSLPLI